MRRRRLRTVGFETTPYRVSRRAILCAKLPAAERAEGSTPSPKHLTSIPFSAFQLVSLATSQSRPSYFREISSALRISFAAVPLASCSSSAGIRNTRYCRNAGKAHDQMFPNSPRTHFALLETTEPNSAAGWNQYTLHNYTIELLPASFQNCLRRNLQ